MKRAVRYSEKREAILRLLQSTQSHPTADWIYQSLKPTHPDLSLGTVYRNLAFFQEQGTERSGAVVGGQERYDAGMRPHSHFICDRCGAVLDLPEIPVDRELDRQVSEGRCLRVSHHDLVFHGTCSCCTEE